MTPSGNLRRRLVLIWHTAWVDRFGQCFIPRKVDRAAPEARSCSSAPPAESPWHPPVGSANSDSDHHRSLSRCSSRSLHRPPPCYSSAPLVAPFYSFSTSFADFETRFSPEFCNHTCVRMSVMWDWKATLIIRLRILRILKFFTDKNVRKKYSCQTVSKFSDLLSSFHFLNLSQIVFKWNSTQFQWIPRSKFLLFLKNSFKGLIQKLIVWCDIRLH